MEERAYCGLDCDSCPVYQATLSRDDALLDALAAEYSGEEFSIAGDDLACLGCHTDFASEKMCGACGIRNCGMERDIAHCGECPEYPCEVTAEYLAPEHPGRQFLDAYTRGQ